MSALPFQHLNAMTRKRKLAGFVHSSPRIAYDQVARPLGCCYAVPHLSLKHGSEAGTKSAHPRHLPQFDRSGPRAQPRMMMNFTIASAALGPAVLLELHGEFDLEAVPVFERVVRDELARGVRLLVLDLDALLFIDSRGIYALLEMLREARAERGDVRIVLTNRHISRVFELSGIDRALRFFPNRAAALAAS